MKKTTIETFFDVMKIIGLAGAVGCNTYANVLDSQYDKVIEQVEVGAISEEQGAILCQEYVDQATGQRMAVNFLLPMGVLAVIMGDAEKKKSKETGRSLE